MMLCVVDGRLFGLKLSCGMLKMVMVVDFIGISVEVDVVWIVFVCLS